MLVDYKDKIVELKKELEVARDGIIYLYKKKYPYYFSDKAILTIIEKLPTASYQLNHIENFDYHRYGPLVIKTINSFVRKHKINISDWRTIVTNEYIKEALSSKSNSKVDEPSENIIYIKEGTKVLFLYGSTYIETIVKNVENKGDKLYCSLQRFDNGEYLVNEQGKRRVWVVETLLKNKKIILDEREKEKIKKKIDEEEQKKEAYKTFLDKSVIFSNNKLTYNEEQLQAIVSFENTLVTARAGSGKTRVIMGKILYLMEIEKMSKENIMSFCFNREIKNEINRRFNVECFVDGENKYLGYEFAKTFHSLAYNITKMDKEEKILQNKSDFIKQVINKMKKDNPNFIKEIYTFFKDSSFYIDRKYFDSPSAYYKYLKNSRYKTLNGEEVKSRGEKLIADFLFEHGIEYVYEKSFFPSRIEPRWPIFLGREEYGRFYKLIKEKDETKPDFYLLNHKFVWEHWAITGNETPMEIGEFECSIGSYNDYKNNKKWKQEFWNSRFLKNLESCKQNNAFKVIKGFIETEDPYFQNKTNEEIETYLKTVLEKKGIVCKKLPEDVLCDKVWKKAIDGFTLLIEQFINKLQQHYFDDMDLFFSKLNNVKNPKAVQLYKLGYSIYQEYMKILHSDNKGAEFAKYSIVTTDYNELIYKAIRMVDEGQYDYAIKNIKWILIDEYQDFSKLFDTLITSIIKINSEIKVFAVGDDWQAINRFAGSDTKYFHSFPDTYTYSDLLNLRNNYRSDKIIVETANKFMKITNKKGAESKCVSNDVGVLRLLDINKEYVLPEKNPIFRYMGLEDESDFDRYTRAKYLKICFDIIKANQDKTIMILNRKNIFLGKEKNDFNAILRRIVKKYIDTYDYDNNVRISTVHSMKGEEADIVILLDVNEGAFPVHNPNNDLFEIFGQNVLDCIDDEEKLFYVALTRAKHKLYITYDSRNRSEFVKFIEKK